VFLASNNDLLVFLNIRNLKISKKYDNYKSTKEIHLHDSFLPTGFRVCKNSFTFINEAITGMCKIPFLKMTATRIQCFVKNSVKHQRLVIIFNYRIFYEGKIRSWLASGGSSVFHVVARKLRNKEYLLRLEHYIT
jgi:hypothetical protein